MKPLRIGLVGLQSPGGAAISDALQTIPGVEPIAIADDARAIASTEIDALVISATAASEREASARLALFPA